jgi:L-rhamnose mutarotase
MKRIAFIMSVNPDKAVEYERRHSPIWPELTDTLRKHGVRDYSIFHDAATHQLFAYAVVEDEERWKAIAQTDVCRRWWRHMGDVMPSNPDSSPVSRELREVFNLG